MTLPICRQRGASVKPGYYVCRSNRLIHAIPGVASGATCKICPYANRRNRFLLGEMLAKWFRRFGVKQSAGCGCAARQRKLDILSIQFVTACKSWISRTLSQIVKWTRQGE